MLQDETREYKPINNWHCFNTAKERFGCARKWPQVNQLQWVMWLPPQFSWNWAAYHKGRTVDSNCFTGALHTFIIYIFTSYLSSIYISVYWSPYQYCLFSYLILCLYCIIQGTKAWENKTDQKMNVLHLSIKRSIKLLISQSVLIPIHLSICPSFCLSVCLSNSIVYMSNSIV